MNVTEHYTELASDLDPARVLWTERFPGGAHWSYRVRRGTTLRFIALDAGANASVLLYRADERMERLNLPDTLKAQHTARLTKGYVLYSDMGRILCSITDDTLGWHDPIGGRSSAKLVEGKYGTATYQKRRNDFHRNAHDSFLIELEKWGLDARDLTPERELLQPS